MEERTLEWLDLLARALTIGAALVVVLRLLIAERRERLPLPEPPPDAGG